MADPLSLVRVLDEPRELAEVVDVLGEADLVHAPRRGGLREALDGGGCVLDRPLPVRGLAAEVHVVVDDHDRRRVSTKARSEAVVTLTRRWSPSTIRTRPPAASTKLAQSVAGSSRSSARRRTSVTKACGVCTA